MNNVLSTRVNNVKLKLLKNHNIKVKDGWLHDCVKFFIGQMPSIDDKTLYQQAYDQFLLANLSDASDLVIPPAILGQKKPFTLDGTFVLQMNFIIDIGELL